MVHKIVVDTYPSGKSHIQYQYLYVIYKMNILQLHIHSNGKYSNILLGSWDF